MANISIADLTPTSLETITAYTIGGKFLGIMDELQNATISNTEDTEERTGKNGRVIAVLKRNKSVTVTATNGLLSFSMMHAQTGGVLESGDITEEDGGILRTENIVLKPGENTAKITGTPTGAGLTAVYVKSGDMAGFAFEEYPEKNTDVPEKKYNYQSSSKTITFNDNFNQEEGTSGVEIVVQYKSTIKDAAWVNNPTDSFALNAQLYIDALAEDRCGNTYHVQFYMPKCSISGNFDIDFGDNQSVHNFEARVLAGGCGVNSNDFWTATIFGVEDASGAAKISLPGPQRIYFTQGKTPENAEPNSVYIETEE